MPASTTIQYILVLIAGLILFSYSHRHPHKVAPFRALLNFVLAHRVSRLAILCIWWWLGWHFLGSPEVIKA
ncbi:MAG: hypothetical protein RL414_897 [Actinomycetota bacterium]|jgi:hypothetical protein